MYYQYREQECGDAIIISQLGWWSFDKSFEAVILFTKHVTQQLGNRKFRGTFAQLGVDDFVPQLN